MEVGGVRRFGTPVREMAKPSCFEHDRLRQGGQDDEGLQRPNRVVLYSGARVQS
jgi:hypothetical protein